MKIYFYNRAAIEGFDEVHNDASNVVEVSGRRDDGLEIDVEEGHIKSDNSGGPNPPIIGESVPIDSEQMLLAATTAITEAVEICGASPLHSDDISTTAASKSDEGDGSAEASHFGIEETTVGPMT